LFQSYLLVAGKMKALPRGIEPLTFRLTAECSTY
jgi:hypothetical protein